MTKTISRTLKLYTYPVSTIFLADGNVELSEGKPIIAEKMLTDQEIKKITMKEYPGIQVYVGEPTFTEDTYSMPLELFIETCKEYNKENN